MSRPIESPQLNGRDSVLGDVWTHPAYATIGASRVSGQTHLFGSNIGHSGYVVIRICAAERFDKGHSESIHGGNRSYIEVALSEAQWVGLVSRMNIGTGVPCTLTRLGGELIPGLPDPGKAVEKLESQIETIKANVEAEAKAALARLLELIDGKVPKKMLDEVRSLANQMSGHFGSNQRLYEKCLTETKERLVAESQVEIDAMITAAVSNLGLESIAQLSAILSDPVQSIEMLKLMGPKP